MRTMSIVASRPSRSARRPGRVAPPSGTSASSASSASRISKCCSAARARSLAWVGLELFAAAPARSPSRPRQRRHAADVPQVRLQRGLGREPRAQVVDQRERLFRLAGVQRGLGEQTFNRGGVDLRVQRVERRLASRAARCPRRRARRAPAGGRAAPSRRRRRLVARAAPDLAARAAAAARPRRAGPGRRAPRRRCSRRRRRCRRRPRAARLGAPRGRASTASSQRPAR